jgi:hypothetical protein
VRTLCANGTGIQKAKGALQSVRIVPSEDALLPNEGVACTYIYEPISILTHGSLDLVGDRHAAFPLFW